MTKALSPEEKPIIENIVSLFQQLLSMEGNEGMAEELPEEPAMKEPLEEVVEMADGEEDEEEFEEVDVAKADGETGDSDAEERLDEQTGTTEQSLQELGKSLRSIQKSLTSNVKKSRNNGRDELTKLLNIVLKNQRQQDKLNKQLLTSMGVTDDVLKDMAPKTALRKAKPIQNISPEMVTAMFSEVFKNIPGLTKNPEAQHPFNQKRDVRKDLRGIAEYVSQNTRK